MASSLNLISDPSFENGTGWTITDPDNDSSTLRYSGNYFGAAPHTGDWFIWGGEIEPDVGTGSSAQHAGTVQQTDIPTTPGVTYVLSFWLRNLGYDGPAINDAEVYWDTFPDGSPMVELTNIAATSDYQQYTYDVVGTGSDTLTFELWNPPTAVLLDDVSLTASPEPSQGGLVGLAIGVALLMGRLGYPARR